MQSVFINLNNVQTNILTWGDPFDSKNSDVIICITGNPGIPHFYEEFGTELNKSTGLPICVIGWLYIMGHHREAAIRRNEMAISLAPSNAYALEVSCVPMMAHHVEEPLERVCFKKQVIGQAGHVEVPEEKSNVLERQEHLFNLEGQVQHKLDLIEHKIHKHRNIHLIGHSIGAWLVLEAINKRENLVDRICSINLLFPTIQKMAESPNGKHLNAIVRRLHYVAILLFTVIQMLPDAVKRFIVSTYLKLNRLPQHYDERILKYIRPRVMEKVLHMAYDEMDRVVALDDVKAALARTKGLINVVYGSKDGWAPASYMEDLQQFQPDLQMKKVDIDHTFVLTSSEKVAELVSDFIKPKIKLC